MNRDFRSFFPLQCSKMKTTPKFWIAVVLTFLITGGMALDYLRSAAYLNASIQVCEVAIMFFSYRVTFMFYIFCLAFILSDAPFFDGNTIYYISRMSGSRWMRCVSKYILFVAATYALYIFIIGCILTVGRMSLAPSWSVSAQAIAANQLQIGLGQGIYFERSIIDLFSPYAAFIIQYFLVVLYGYFIGIIIAILNIRMKHNVGFIAGVALHALMLVLSLDNLPMLRYFSLYNYACLSAQSSIGSVWISAAILVLLDLALTRYGIRVTKSADISTTTLEWIS
ncbi:MAG: hypothetical protein RSE23_03645 [Clostridia bacterium]